MARADTNVTILIGRLTRDPELKSLPSGTSVCNIRLAFSTTRKDNSTGEWVEKSNFIDVTVWGQQGENCARYLAKGRQIAVKGHLEWREWTDRNDAKHQSIEVVAEPFGGVQFLGGDSDGGGRDDGGFRQRTGESDVPAGDSDFAPASAPTPAPDDDIPF